LSEAKDCEFGDDLLGRAGVEEWGEVVRECWEGLGGYASGLGTHN